MSKSQSVERSQRSNDYAEFEPRPAGPRKTEEVTKGVYARFLERNGRDHLYKGRLVTIAATVAATVLLAAAAGAAFGIPQTKDFMNQYWYITFGVALPGLVFFAVKVGEAIAKRMRASRDAKQAAAKEATLDRRATRRSPQARERFHRAYHESSEDGERVQGARETWRAKRANRANPAPATVTEPRQRWQEAKARAPGRRLEESSRRVDGGLRGASFTE